MLCYVAICALWVGYIDPLLDPGGTPAAKTIGFIAFIGLTGALLYRAIAAQTLQLDEARAAQLVAEEHLRAFIDNSPTRISFKDLDGRFVLVNRAFANWFGIEAATLPGRSVDDVFPRDLAKTYSDMDEEVRASRRPSEFRITHQRKGEARISNLIKFPVHARSGELTGIGTIASDATEQVEAEKTLRRARDEADAANRAKSQFLAAMSHELRTPLNAIIGFSEMLVRADGKQKGAQVREYGEAIHQSGRHLLGIINDILDISRIEAGKLVLNEEAIDVRHVVADTVQLVKQRAAEGDVRIEMSIADDCTCLWADEQRLLQILLNLVSNAVKFTPAGGSVEICAFGDAEFRIEVRDTGIGIAAEDIPQALAPFGQVDSRLQRSYEGTGLGLPLSKALTELHGGRLEVHSRLGEGTTIAVVLSADRMLPLERGPSDQPPPKAPCGPPPSALAEQTTSA